MGWIRGSPSERALATELGVSRNSVREALDHLTARELIIRRQAAGVFVKYRSVEDLKDSGSRPLADQTGLRSSRDAWDFRA